MGQVVVATHLQLDQTVALKFLHDELGWQPEIVERLIREARASAKLKSEHVCRVMDVGQLESGTPYIVMELLDGEDLSSLIRRTPLSPALAAEYVLQACVAIAEAHAADIVHRDLKPSNLFITERLDGTPLIKVLDFGIAKAPSKAEMQITRTTAVMGSPGYMSPEQLRSSKIVDARTDLWSLGVILYEAVSGALPFRADTITELAVKVSVDPPEALPPNIDPAYAAVVARCLAKPVEQRYQSIADLAVDLARIAGPRGATSAAMIARLAGRNAPPPPIQQVAPTVPIMPSPEPPPVAAVPPPTDVPPVAVSVPLAPVGPAQSAQLHAAPPLVGAPSGRGRIAWWWIALAVGGIAALTVILIVGAGSPDPASPDPETPVAHEPRPPGPGKLEGSGEAKVTAGDREEALKFLELAYAQQRAQEAAKKGEPPPPPPTRDEALAFLDQAYAQQKAQQEAQEANEPDPDAVFAVDIAGAIRGGQVIGANSATVTVVEAWDFA